MNTQKVIKDPHRLKVILWSVALLVAAILLLPLTGYLYTGIVTAQTSEETNPRSDYWRMARQGAAGNTTVRGQETGVLVQSGGETWRQLRNGPVKYYGSMALGSVLLLLLLYQLLHGRVKIEGGKSGRTVPRWSLIIRVLHWYVAILFILLAVTGLSLLYGRSVLIPAFGLEGFAAWAQVAKVVHDYIGPPFVAGIVLMLIVMLPYNLPEKHDIKWLSSGGGLLGKGKHPHCGRINAGEKLFTYGAMLILGIVVSISGLVLDFPNYDQTRETMQLANVLHAGASVLWLAIMLGHIYLGLWGVEGSLEAMTRGHVDENWAKQHHDLWYETLAETATRPESGVTASSTPKPEPGTTQPG